MFRLILDQPNDELRSYNACDCERTFEGGVALKGDMALFKAQDTHDEMLALAPAVRRMEDRGLPINQDTLRKMAERTKAGINFRSEIVNDVFREHCADEYEATQAFNNFFRRFFNKRRRDVVKPVKINPRSKPQLITLLGRLGFKWTQTTFTGRSQLDLDILMKLRREHGAGPHDKLLESLWEFAKLDKLRADWLDGLAICDDGRLRASVRVTGTASGRLSESTREWCSYCQKENHGRNRQNMPRATDTISAAYAPIRSMVQAPPGRLLVERDFSAMEAWIGAILSGDPVFLSRLRSGNIHRLNAADFFQVPAEKVTTLQYSMSKIILYGGMLYEGGPETVRDSLEEYGFVVPLHEVKLYQARWKITHHRYVQACHNWVQEAARARPMHTTTALGRRRNFIGDPKTWRRDCIAHKISGTGAGHTNRAMIELDDAGWEIILHNHDSLALEIDDTPADIERAYHATRDAFERDRGIGHLPSEFKAGRTLADMKPWRPGA